MFRVDWESKMREFAANPITIQPQDIINWMSEHNYPDRVRQSFRDMFSDGWEKFNINKFAAHAKVEQVTKLKMIGRWYTEVVSRAIVGAPYCISAIFAGFFKQIKMRLKELLDTRCVYADGMTPWDLNAKIQSLTGSDNNLWIVEDDLSMQDAQTSQDELNIEHILYHMLGGDSLTIDFYMLCHKDWKWKAHGIKGLWTATRCSGEDTTSLGNSICNMICHTRFFERNMRYIKMYAFLGDDVIFISDKKLDVTGHGTETQKYYNLISKIEQKHYVGNFLSMLVVNWDGKTQLVPHYKRLRHRYSVCNHSFSSIDMIDKVKSRTLSYCLMLGGIKNVHSIAFKINPGVPILNWYEPHVAIMANALYDQTNENTVINQMGCLINMLEQQKPEVHLVKHFGSSHK